jgi:hypothetical protein
MPNRTTETLKSLNLQHLVVQLFCDVSLDFYLFKFDGYRNNERKGEEPGIFLGPFTFLGFIAGLLADDQLFDTDYLVVDGKPQKIVA